MNIPPIDRQALAEKLRRGANVVRLARHRSREFSESEARQFIHDATDALITIAEAVADELDVAQHRVDL